ncbi:MAG: hypothetical protein ACXQTI_10690 [Candidatus Nezhaarchaeales archaeon]
MSQQRRYYPRSRPYPQSNINQLSWLDELRPYLLDVEIEDENTVYLIFLPVHYTRSDIVRIIKIIADLHPDEVDIVEGYKLRLWWD